VERVREGEARVKFHAERIGALSNVPGSEAQALCEAITWMAKTGLSPVLEDGAFAGNAAVIEAGVLYVSPSGRRIPELDPDELIEVVSFDVAAWRMTYRSTSPSAKPTSDAPLHFAILREATGASASLHGHVLTSDADAVRTQLPISVDATLFSTPADREGLLSLIALHPYPAHDAWIRRDHGVFVIGASVRSARTRLGALRAT
jgi:hypothetical protein